VLIAAVVSQQEAGLMLLAQRVTSIPVGLLGGSISRVYLAEATQKQSEGRLGEFTRRIMLTLLKIGLGPFLLLAVAAPILFQYIFGEEWIRAGTMVTWLVPYMLLQFVASPVSTILHATGNQAMAMVLQLFGFSLLIGSILLTAKIGSPYVFESFAVAAIIYYLSYIGVIMFLARPKAQS
jgi:O-antigen/teichoic acid export membrane protein